MANPSRETLPEKACVACGRRITWRKKWARDWGGVKYCSDACRRRGVGEVDLKLERALLDLLACRTVGATVCPSEAARLVDPAGWRELMEDARRAARRLVDRGLVDITQRGRVVDLSAAKGPIRVRLRR
ncbi:DUF2256 and DUF3253 domain-containing protein [Humisphaera borealis]|uniref:DUF2256 and DUF3253 domain-containing protein n=1 Tax=Humisphaera borealis TaxID=2807512 RepID=A0A7M2WXC1_9BACT|nr:DUF2256 and DUF3253 domain-containing protein [Humisphaera borealis]QOV89461.1 DUF2256 and DUF3253 domain-containing protein [Humisphaera borealis]